MRQQDPADQEMVECEVFIFAVTMKAVLAAPQGCDEEDAKWLARSQCQFSKTPQRDTGDTIGIKRWLARREGFIE